VFDINVAIVGAGPYGLSAAMHLRRAGVEVLVFGDPMSFWRTMPSGMLLRSNWTATCIGEYQGPLSLDSYCAATGARLSRPFPLARFIEYGTWVQQQVAPDVDRRVVEHLDGGDMSFRLLLADGERLRARRVVIATGIAPFAHRPPVADGLPTGLASHTGDHRDLSRFSGARVLLVGGGQSALESAALLNESGAQVEIIARADHLNWLHGGRYHRRLGRLAPLFYAPTDVGPLGLSRLVAVPDAFRRLPRRVQEPLAYRSIRPAGAAWLVPRLRDVPVILARSVVSVTETAGGLKVALSGGETRTVDHLLFGTGYRVDIARYSFLAPSLLASVKRAGGYPVLGRGMRSSVAGLHFLGAPAAWSFGPTMRFVSGGWYAGRTLTQVVAAPVTARRRTATRPSVTTVSGIR
jgi:FAD-dependent urate hydroxylase